MISSFEEASSLLPKYLSPAGKQELFAEIRNFFELRGADGYYANFQDEEPIQGDGWSEIPCIVDVQKATVKRTRVCVVSNSCDISDENANGTWGSFVPVTIVPIVRLDRFRQLLLTNNISQTVVDEKIRTIRRQEISTIFFLPKGQLLEEDSIALLDLPYPTGRSLFDNAEGTTRLFRLSQMGWWLFLVKLAIHLCRAQENIQRNNAGQG